MEDEKIKKHSFWTSASGILTGIAAIITAVTGLIIAFSSMDNREPATSIKQHETPYISGVLRANPSDWPIIYDETFSLNQNGWNIGEFTAKTTPKFDLRVVDGNYRWDVSYSTSRRRHILAPTGTVINFSLGVDVKVKNYTPDAAFSLIFCATESSLYSFNVSTNGKYNLAKIDTEDMSASSIISWSLFNADFNPKEWNRIGIIVNEQIIKFYINSKLVGEYKETDLSGGKVGLGLSLYQKGVAVVDFDNYQLRRKP